MGSMLGVVVSDSFLMLFVYLGADLHYLLPADRLRSPREARPGARPASAGHDRRRWSMPARGLDFPLNISGVTQLSLLIHGGDLVRESPFYLAALLLILGGCFTKSAQFPFHSWLPNAMEAPTPFSAYLHSATMVKAGVLFADAAEPVLGETPAWEILLPFFGGLTLIIGTLLSLRQTDLKLMLAYTTMASLGLLVMLTGFDSEHAIAAAVLYLVARIRCSRRGSWLRHCRSRGRNARRDEAWGFAQGHAHHLCGRAAGPPFPWAACFSSAFCQGRNLLCPAGRQSALHDVYAGRIVGNGLMFAIAFAVALKPFIGRKV